MKVKILRSVMVTPVGQAPRPADVNEIVDVDKAQAMLLIGIGKAQAHGKPEAVKATAAPVESATVESADVRPNARSRG